jgi:hypothetical protein
METEWLEEEGGYNAVPLAVLIYPTVERWVPVIMEIVQRGDHEYIARALQSIVDDEINTALSKLERSIVKEIR